MLEKGPVAAVVLTRFKICNPSNVLSPIWSPKLIFREVNCKYYLGRVMCENSHTKVKKHKNVNVDISKVLGTFRSHFGAQASNRKANHAANRRSLAATAGKPAVRLKSGGANEKKR